MQLACGLRRAATVFPSNHSAVIKAALKTLHNCSTVIYMQLKFHVNQDKADGRRAEQRTSGRRRRKRGG